MNRARTLAQVLDPRRPQHLSEAILNQLFLPLPTTTQEHEHMKIDLTFTGLDFAQAQALLNQASGGAPSAAPSGAPSAAPSGTAAVINKVEVRKAAAPAPAKAKPVPQETQDDAPELDAKQVKSAASKFMATYGMEVLTERLGRFGAVKLSDLAPNNYGGFLASLSTAPVEEEEESGSLLD